MNRLFAASLSLGLAISGFAWAQIPYDNSALVAIAEDTDAWQLSGGKTPLSQRPHAGQRFKVTLPVSDFPFDTASWSYDERAGELNLRVTFMPLIMGPQWASGTVPRRVASMSAMVRGVGLLKRPGKTTTYAATNVFGAKFDVTRNRNTIFGIALLEMPTSSDEVLDYFNVPTTSIKFPREQVSAATKSLVWIAEGEVVPYEGDRVGACGSAFSSATFAQPRDNFTKFCLVSVRFDRMAFVDLQSGKPLKEWSRATPRPLPVTQSLPHVGPYWVQIGMFSSREIADGSLRMLPASSVTHDEMKIEPVSSGAYTLYRTSVGFSSEVTAISFCETLKKNGKSCFVKK